MQPIHLRPLEDSDADSVHRLLSNMDVIRYMLIPLHDEAAAREFVTEARTLGTNPSWQSLIRGIAGAEGELIGLCGLVIRPENEDAEAWYLLEPRYWGRGLATEAGRQLLEIGFTDFQLHRIWAGCLPANPASARVLEKLGMRHEGYQRQNLRVHGEWQDSHLYAILREEWLSRRAVPPSTAP